MKHNYFKKQGFALLYAILISGVIAIVGIILVNITTKQIVFSSLSRNSEISYYYLANSARECLEHYVALNPGYMFYNKDWIDPSNHPLGTRVIFTDTTSAPLKLSCFGTKYDVELFLNSADPNYPIYRTNGNVTINDVAGSRQVNLSVQFNSDCVLNLGHCPNSTGTSLITKNRAVITTYGQNPSTGSQVTRRTAVAAFN